MSGLPDYAEALGAALRAVDANAVSRIEEEVAIDAASGRVLATPIVADRDLPPFNRAMMDGYALRAADFNRDRALTVVGELPAGAPPQIRVPPGSCVKIATGAALPDDCDTVIQHESSDRGNPVRFTIDRVDPGQAVHPRAADARQGALLVQPGTVLAAQHLGIAAAVGATTLAVRARPRASVLSSGDEVVADSTPLTQLLPHQIRNSNGAMVRELLHRFGAQTIATEHVPDEREATIEAVRSALKASDVVVTIGGVSAGERDHFPAAFDACKVQRFLQGASIQPGRPIVVGRAPNDAIVIALPGNPVSVLACTCLFAWPIVRAMVGLSPSLPWREIELAEAVKPNAHRRAFRPAIVRDDGRAVVPTWAGSGDLAHTAPTHGLVELPVQSEPVAAGKRLRFLPWP